MSDDVQKLKQAIVILKREKSDFKRYNEHLRTAIIGISESNEKLLFSLHEKYKYFGELENQNKGIEINVQNKLKNICNFDFNVEKSDYMTNSSISKNILTKKNSKSSKVSNAPSQDKLSIHNKNNQVDFSSQMNSEIRVSAIYNLSFSENTKNREKKLNPLGIENDGNKDQESIIKSNNRYHGNKISPLNLSCNIDLINQEQLSEDAHSQSFSDLNNSMDSSLGSSINKNSHSNTHEAIKSIALKSFEMDSDLNSVEKLKEKQNMLIETNQKLKSEIENLLSKVDETDLFFEIQKESESYLKALMQLHELESRLGIHVGTDKTNDDHLQSKNLVDEKNNQSGIFLTDIDPKNNSETNNDHESNREQNNNFLISKKIDHACQTNISIRSKSFMKYFSKEVRQKYLEKQATKIAFRKKSINDLIFEIEKSKNILNELQTKKTQVTAELSAVQNIYNIDIDNQISYDNKETETDIIVDIEQILSQIKENSQYTKLYLIHSNDKSNLKAIYDQKSLELKIAQIATDRKTTIYRSLLRTLKTTDPDCYAKYIGTVGMTSKAEQKRQRYIQQINKFTEKIKRANDETIEIEMKEKQVKLRLEMLERELMVFKNPKDHIKSTLTDLCQNIALNQEKIRDQMRELTFVKLETDFIERIKMYIFKKSAQTDELSQKINEMFRKIKKIKGRCRYSIRTGQEFAITSPSELENLRQNLDSLENDVKMYDEQINFFAQKTSSCYKQLIDFNLKVPTFPKLCETIQNNLKNVM